MSDLIGYANIFGYEKTKYLTERTIKGTYLSLLPKDILKELEEKYLIINVNNFQYNQKNKTLIKYFKQSSSKTFVLKISVYFIAESVWGGFSFDSPCYMIINVDAKCDNISISFVDDPNFANSNFKMYVNHGSILQRLLAAVIEKNPGITHYSEDIQLLSVMKATTSKQK